MGLLLWILAVLFIVWGVVNVFQGAIIWGVVLIILGLLIGGMGPFNGSNRL